MLRAALRDVHKRFGETQALAGARLEIAAGEVHALLGENGAGKSTLMRVLYGAVQPDRGHVEIEGRPVVLQDPRAALARGIGMVHQHSMLVPALSVAENLMLGEPGVGWIGRATLQTRARALLERYELELDPARPVRELSVGQLQRLEIVRALARGVTTLILDEPTAVLAPAEVRSLLALLRQLRDAGCSIVFISHKLSEIFQVCDRVTVLRAGVTIGTREIAQVDAAELARWMVGHEPPPPSTPPRVDSAAPLALALRGLSAEGLHGIDLELRAGEIVALAGIDGNGQGPLEEVLAGVRRATAGSIEVVRGPLAIISGDRQRTGLVLDLTVEENLVLEAAAHPRRGASGQRGDRGGASVAEGVFRRGLLSRTALRAHAQRVLAPYALRGTSDRPARLLSGGNQQKVLVARALGGAPGVVVAVNPTRGLDVDATATVRAALRARAEAGAGVLLISTDLDEVLELGTRVSVLFRGRLLEVEPERRTRERIGERMLGREAVAAP